MIPGMDYLRYTYSGAALLNTGDFDTVCKKCSKSGSLRDRYRQLIRNGHIFLD